MAKRDKLIQSSADGDWSRHANFMMRHIGCGHKPPDYYVSFGYYYCSTYGDELLPRLSKAGQVWLKNARKYLQKNMEEGLKDNMEGDVIDVPCIRYPDRSVYMDVPQLELEVDIETFRNFAFKTHVPAYLDAGLADLSVWDQLKIGGQPNVEEWGKGETWEQATDSFVTVAGEWAGRAANATGQALQRALDTLTRHLN